MGWRMKYMRGMGKRNTGGDKMRGGTLVWMGSIMAVLTSCVSMIQSRRVSTEEDRNTSLMPFLLQDPPMYDDDDTCTHLREITSDISRSKRVFLSRGWGPGGYDSPPLPPPPLFVRQHPSPPAPYAPVASAFSQSLPLTDQAGKARFEALVSTRQQDIQTKPPFRRFHSIFTSGTWSPLGKRSRGINHIIPQTEEQSTNNKNEDEVLMIPQTHLEDKRSVVFASHGWGAGGSPHSTWSSSSPLTTWTRHPWLAVPLIASHNTPMNEDSGRKGSGGTGSENYLANFRRTKPRFHHFLSHGWRPMGR